MPAGAARAFQGVGSPDRIDFISTFCDRWCERCAFTERCSAFATHCALAVGEDDLEEAPELANGQRCEAVPDADPVEPPPWMADFDNAAPAAEALALCEREEAERETRIDRMPVMQAAHAYNDAHAPVSGA